MKTLKIKIFTTEGCEACRIMKNLVARAVEDYLNINVYVIKVPLDDNSIAKENNITDYPTTICMSEDENKIYWTLVGTYPKTYIIDCIQNVLNN